MVSILALGNLFAADYSRLNTIPGILSTATTPNSANAVLQEV